MGRIAAPFGVKGWIKVQPETEGPGGLLAYKTWWLLGRDGDWREAAVAEAKVQGAMLAARLEGCRDRDSAAALRGDSVAVPRSQLPQARSGEYYWADLLGLRVVNTQARELGRIEQILQTGANDVLVVRGDRERLVPFIADVIREVDTATGVVRVEWGVDY
jgi:16S rRNA processing protein RimM